MLILVLKPQHPLVYRFCVLHKFNVSVFKMVFVSQI